MESLFACSGHRYRAGIADLAPCLAMTRATMPLKNRPESPTNHWGGMGGYTGRGMTGGTY